MTHRVLVRVVASHFVAGLTVERATRMVTRDTAPILRWTVGRPWDAVRRTMLARGWAVEVLG